MFDKSEDLRASVRTVVRPALNLIGLVRSEILLADQLIEVGPGRPLSLRKTVASQ